MIGWNDAGEMVRRLIENVARIIVGNAEGVELMLVALLCEGHVLLEDVPGVGKTLLAKALARSLDCTFRRIQFTPELLPSDIIGSRVFNQQIAAFEFLPGPVFAQIVLADDVNRATPRTQAALLEVMEERQVTSGGVTVPLRRPFLVLATQNPVDLEGTSPLPEAQLDRFLLRVRLGYPTADEEEEILLRFDQDDPLDRLKPVLSSASLGDLMTLASTVRVSEDMRRYLVAVVRTTRQWPGVLLGGSPRATLALYRSARALALVRGRSSVLPDDVKALAGAVLGHRLLLTPEARVEARSVSAILGEVLDKVPVPGQIELGEQALTAMRKAAGRVGRGGE